MQRSKGAGGEGAWGSQGARGPFGELSFAISGVRNEGGASKRTHFLVILFEKVIYLVFFNIF